MASVFKMLLRCEQDVFMVAAHGGNSWSTKSKIEMLGGNMVNMLYVAPGHESSGAKLSEKDCQCLERGSTM